MIADVPGVALLEPERLLALNLVNPMITLATVAPCRQMAASGMVGTVKIISYAVPQSDLDAACDAARGAVSLAPVRLKSASLIVTEIDGGAGDKGVTAVEGRLTALGMHLDDVAVVPHRRDAIAGALAGVCADLVLVLTGSATSDPHDIAPEAVRDAGGQVARFGMPVDPGNLLFLGRIGARPVIGLPGCARSPALNGADFVLSRVACGLDVSADDIAAMGVGGLLKEIASRPRPRSG